MDGSARSGTGRTAWPGFRVGTALLLLAATALAGGCKFTGPQAASACEWMSQPPPSGGRTAILVDTSNSTRAAGTRIGAPDYAAATRDAIQAAVDRRDTVSVAGFSGIEPDLGWSVKDQSTDWQRDNPNSDNQRDRRDEAISCLDHAVTAAQLSAPRAPDTDILRAVAAAADWLRQGSGPRQLVLATDGLVTTGCANLVHARLRSDTEIDAIARTCREAQEVRPDELNGVNVLVLGVGRSAAHQPIPTPAQAQWLVRLWQRLCAEADATCRVSAASVAGTGDGPAGSPVPSVTDAVVPFGDGTQVIYSVPAAGLFDSGRWAVRPAAVPLLVDIAVATRTGRNARVTVNGYADPRGTAGDNLALSQRRADAVRDVLVANGVTSIEAHGLGETTGCPDHGAVGTGADADLQCARRVDIVVTRT
jgi:outer membrane protein OmpA-like peptidoglycan-associated protein